MRNRKILVNFLIIIYFIYIFPIQEEIIKVRNSIDCKDNYIKTTDIFKEIPRRGFFDRIYNLAKGAVLSNLFLPIPINLSAKNQEFNKKENKPEVVFSVKGDVNNYFNKYRHVNSLLFNFNQKIEKIKEDENYIINKLYSKSPPISSSSFYAEKNKEGGGYIYDYGFYYDVYVEEVAKEKIKIPAQYKDHFSVTYKIPKIKNKFKNIKDLRNHIRKEITKDLNYKYVLDLRKLQNHNPKEFNEVIYNIILHELLGVTNKEQKEFILSKKSKEKEIITRDHHFDHAKKGKEMYNHPFGVPLHFHFTEKIKEGKVLPYIGDLPVKIVDKENLIEATKLIKDTGVKLPELYNEVFLYMPNSKGDSAVKEVIHAFNKCVDVLNEDYYITRYKKTPYGYFKGILIKVHPKLEKYGNKFLDEIFKRWYHYNRVADDIEYIGDDIEYVFDYIKRKYIRYNKLYKDKSFIEKKAEKATFRSFKKVPELKEKITEKELFSHYLNYYKNMYFIIRNQYSILKRRFIDHKERILFNIHPYLYYDMVVYSWNKYLKEYRGIGFPAYQTILNLDRDIPIGVITFNTTGNKYFKPVSYSGVALLYLRPMFLVSPEEYFSIQDKDHMKVGYKIIAIGYERINNNLIFRDKKGRDLLAADIYRNKRFTHKDSPFIPFVTDVGQFYIIYEKGKIYFEPYNITYYGTLLDPTFHSYKILSSREEYYFIHYLEK